MFVGCANYNSSNKINQKSYLEDIGKINEYFPKKLTNHFPDSITGSYRLISDFPSSLKQNNRCGVILIDYNFKGNIENDSIIQSYEYKISPNEKCLLIVNMFENEISGKIYLDNLRYYCDNFFPPIPDFHSILPDSIDIEFMESGRLSNKYALYVIDSQPGYRLLSDQLSRGYGLPEKWGNGYSKGVAINKNNNLAIFWLEVW